MRNLFKIPSIFFLILSLGSCDPIFANTKVPAKDVTASGFTGHLSGDTDVQGALNTIDQFVLPVTFPSAGIAVSTGSAWAASITNNSANWDTAYTDRLKWDGGSAGLVAATARTSLGLGSAALSAASDFLAVGATATNSSGLEGHNAAYFQVAGSYEVTSNKVTSISAGSTDTQYPSAKLLYDQLATKQGTGAYLTAVTADSPLSGAGTSASHLVVDLSSKQAASSILSALAGLTYVSGSPRVIMTGAATFGLDSTTYLTSLAGALLATGATTGATSQPQVFTDGYYSPEVTDTVVAGAVTVNWATSLNHYIVLGNGVNTITMINPAAIAGYRLILKQPASGAAGTVTFSPVPKANRGTLPTLTTANNSLDVIYLNYSTAAGSIYWVSPLSDVR